MTRGTDGLALKQERRMRASATWRTAMLRDEAARLRDEAVRLRDEETRLHAAIIHQRNHIEAQAATLLEDRRQAARQLDEAATALRDMTADRDRMEHAGRVTAAEHQRLLQSTAWRVTAPLRWAMDRIPVPVRRLLRRGLRSR